MSYDRRKHPLATGALPGSACRPLFGVLVLKTTPGRWFFESVGGVVNGLLGFTLEGARFVFGNLVQPTVPVGTPQPAEALDGAAGFVASTGASSPSTCCPTIIFFSALMSVLYHLGVMQLVVKGLAFGHAAHAAHVGGGDALGERQHLPRPDRGAALDPALRRPA